MVLKNVRESPSASPFNAFGHAPALAGPEDRFVSINNDTIYSIAQVDVSGGPVLLRVPESHPDHRNRSWRQSAQNRRNDTLTDL
jgi:hypothetical protein